jgi:Ca2+/Na+ antiporter
MAAGSSAPELFSSIVSISSPSASEELGVGTIVGSAVFNILVIIGATAIAAGRPLSLDWWPLARDGVFYFASVISILLVFWDGRVQCWEGLIFVCLYLAYIAFMSQNEKLSTRAKTFIPSTKIHNEGDTERSGHKGTAAGGGTGGDTEVENLQVRPAPSIP